MSESIEKIVDVILQSIGKLLCRPEDRRKNIDN